ncbi:MAG: tol-pal system-associated acyl-CoA thioesterase [Burkholderiaceae bacterium]
MTSPATRAFAHPVRVYWEDTDAGGIVYYANYLRFFERARTEWLRSLGIEQQALRERTGAMFVVSESTLKCHLPARLDDRLDVTVDVHHAARASLVLRQQALRGDELLADGEVRIACVDAPTLRLRRIPEDILERIA